MICWLGSWFSAPRPSAKKIVGGRTCDSAIRNRKYNMPSVWYSEEHFHLWVAFLRARCDEELITWRKFREKIRAAKNAMLDQRRSMGYLPAEHEKPGSSYYTETIARALQRKAARTAPG